MKRLLITTLLGLGFALDGSGAIEATGSAQGPTLRQRVETSNGNVHLEVTADSQALTLPDILANTDVVVRGIIGDGVAQLSADEHNITTT